MTAATILGTGSYLPKKILTNKDLESMVDTTDEWIVSRTGIKERRIAAPDETASSMGTQASRLALEAANLHPHELDMIVVATCTPDTMFPSTACHIQHQLGIHQIAAFDVSAACSGFIFALSVADQYIKSGQYQRILVVGSEVMSRTVDWTDRRVCVLFGDGAGAAILGAGEQPGIHSTHLHADGHYEKLLYLPNDKAAPEKSDANPYIHMQGHDVYRLAVTSMRDVSQEALDANHLNGEAIHWLVPHQANVRIIESTVKKLKLSMDQVILTLDKQGNTSAASIPLALDTGIRDGRIKRGDKLLLEGFGGGMAWGAAYITY